MVDRGTLSFNERERWIQKKITKQIRKFMYNIHNMDKVKWSRIISITYSGSGAFCVCSEQWAVNTYNGNRSLFLFGWGECQGDKRNGGMEGGTERKERKRGGEEKRGRNSFIYSITILGSMNTRLRVGDNKEPLDFNARISFLSMWMRFQSMQPMNISIFTWRSVCVCAALDALEK